MRREQRNKRKKKWYRINFCAASVRTIFENSKDDLTSADLRTAQIKMEGSGSTPECEAALANSDDMAFSSCSFYSVGGKSTFYRFTVLSTGTPKSAAQSLIVAD